ncbi:MAG: hypothetical protein JXB15_09715 [Anaerolineales bacterium]|nr:hypothetical protein [Anaerolineales bacterium]
MAGKKKPPQGPAETPPLFTASEPPALLNTPGVTPEFAKALFEAAADYYRAAPWRKLADIQPLQASVIPSGQQIYIQLMGNAGLEYGLIFYDRLEDLENSYRITNNPLLQLPATGLHSLSFEQPTNLPAADRAAAKKYKWPVASSTAYPFPAVYLMDDLQRPDRAELIRIEALLRAIPHFVNGHLFPDPAYTPRSDDDPLEDYLPAEAILNVQTFDGAIEVQLRYPVAITDLVRSRWETLDEEDDEWNEEGLYFNYSDLDDDDFEEEEYEPAPHERVEEADSALQKAQRLMDEAEEEDHWEVRLRLAHRALEFSPDCVEAYLLLAEEDDLEPEEISALYQKAVLAGERTLGKTNIAQWAGRLWRKRRARPYLFALQGLAESLAEQGEAERAQELYYEILRLNTEDHQGIRYSLLDLLMEKQNHPAAQELLDRFAGDPAAAWSYSQALLAFRLEGNSPAAIAALQAALQANPFVPAYLVGRKPMPTEPPLDLYYGNENEAIHYTIDHFRSWWQTPGAVEWLKKNTSGSL